MTDKHWILSDDLSKYITETSEYVSVYSLNAIPGMWGSTMFGSPSLLGSGELNNLVSNFLKQVASDDIGMYVVRRLVLVYISTMSTAPGMWGAAQFGSVNILGTGSLNSVEA